MSGLNGRTTVHSQPEKLREKVEAAGIRHGERARVNLIGVEASEFLSGLQTGEISVQFCHMDRLEVIAKSGEPDGGEVPEEARIENIKIPGEGVYDWLGVELSLNGAMALRRTAASRIVRHRVWHDPLARLRQRSLVG